MLYQKLVIPRIAPYTLSRSTVQSTIDAALTESQVVLLIAPAGWGKTTALAAWAQAHPQDEALYWYTIDEADRDPVLFLRNLLTSLGEGCPQVKDILGQFTSETTASTLQPLINQFVSIIAAHSKTLYLIFDDIHLLDHNGRTQPIFELLGQLARYAPPVRILLTSRTALPGMILLRVQGHLRMLHANTLAFRPEDIIALAQARYGTTLLPNQASMLFEWSHGWPAAVVLALEEWHTQIAPGSITLEALLPKVADHLNAFLGELVLSPLPNDLQAFLIETAVLDELTPARCDMLRESDDAALHLGEVQRRSLFVETRIDHLRYHTLFRNFLLKLLWATPTRARHYMRRAALMHQQAGNHHHAIQRLLEIDDLEAASKLLQEAGPLLRRQGEHAALLSWLEHLRSRMPLPPPLLLLLIRTTFDVADWNSAYTAIQMAIVSNDPELIAEARLLEIQIACVRKESHAHELMAAISFKTLPERLYSMYHEIAGRVALLEGATSRAIEHFRQAIANHQADNRSTDAHPLAHLYDVLGMAMAANRDLAGATYYLSQADAGWQSLGDLGRRVSTLNNRAWVAVEQGRLDAARTYLEEGLHLSEQPSTRRSKIAVLCSLADLTLLEGQLLMALQHYNTAAEYASQVQMSNERVYALAGALRVAALLGDQPECRRLRELLAHTPIEDQALYAGLVSLAHALAVNNTHEIEHYLNEAERQSLYTLHDRAQLLLRRAQLCFQQGGWEATQPFWQQLEELVRSPHLDGLLQIQCKSMRELLSAAGDSWLARRLRGHEDDGVPWKFAALGRCEVQRNGQVVSAQLRPLDQLVLVRLLESRAAGIAALTLWDDIWGDQPFSSDALRQSLSRIRRSTDLPIRLQNSHCQVQLAWTSIEYDVASFEVPNVDNTQVAGLQQQLALYRGAFLGHLNHESRWLAARRTALRRRYLMLREALAQATENDLPHNALQVYMEVLEEDGCREAAAAGAMRCASRLGDRMLAISIYQRLCQKLIDELGTEPSPALEEIYQKIA